MITSDIKLNTKFGDNAGKNPNYATLACFVMATKMVHPPKSMLTWVF